MNIRRILRVEQIPGETKAVSAANCLSINLGIEEARAFVEGGVDSLACSSVLAKVRVALVAMQSDSATCVQLNPVSTDVRLRVSKR